MELGTSKILSKTEAELNNRKDTAFSHKIQELECVVKKQRLELEQKDTEINLLRDELNQNKKFSCEHVFHSYAVYKGTDNIAPCNCRKDYTSLLPDELVAKIFRYLPQEFLYECAQVCKRWKEVFHHKSLWRKIQFSNVEITLEDIYYFIELGVKNLILTDVDVVDSDGDDPSEDEEVSDDGTDASLNESNTESNEQNQQDSFSELETLELSFLVIENYVLSELIWCSTALKNLSISDFEIDSNVCKSISKLKNLITLELISLTITSKSLERILKNCTNLTNLDLSKTNGWLYEPISYFPSQLLDLTLTSVFFSKGSTEQLKEIIQSCPNLTSLTIDECEGLTPAAINYISTYLQSLQFLSLKENTRLNYNLVVLKNIPTLQEICISCEREDMDPLLEDNLKNIKITNNYLEYDYNYDSDYEDI